MIGCRYVVDKREILFHVACNCNYINVRDFFRQILGKEVTEEIRIK
jgi:hypothetical protein